MVLMETLSNLRRMITGSEMALGERQARVIAVAAQKGGVGKTTTAVHLAAGLALFHQRRVLLIDMDAQGHIGLSLAQELTEAVSDDRLGDLLLQKKRDVFELATPTRIHGLSVVPSDRELNETESLMSARIGKEMLLKQALQIARTHFDVILIDCPPNVGNLTVNALVAADQVLIPCDMSNLSLDGVAAIIETMATVQEMLNPSLSLLGLIRTRVDGRNLTMNRAIEDSLSQHYDSSLLGSTINVSTAIARAQLAGRTIFDFDPKNRGAHSYRALAQEIETRLFGC